MPYEARPDIIIHLKTSLPAFIWWSSSSQIAVKRTQKWQKNAEHHNFLEEIIKCDDEIFHSFIQQVYIEDLLSARYCKISLACGAYILVREP